MKRHCKWGCVVHNSFVGFLIMLMIFMESISSPLYAQQVKIESGAYFINSGANIVVNAKVVNAGTITNSGTSTMKLTGDWQNDGTYTPTGCTVSLLGTSSQELGGTNTTTFENLTLNNSNGALLSNGITVTNTFSFTNGKITTGANTFTLGSSATVDGAGSGNYIFGNLQWTLPGSGSPSKTFYIGDASNYTPVIVDFTTISGGGTITASTTSGPHPDGLTSGISGGKLVNRYWTLANSGVTFASCDATFTFVSGDILGGANTSNFIVKRWSASSWSSTNISTLTSTTTKITGLTSFGDFLDGEAGVGCVQSTPPVSASAVPATICSGSNALLSLSGGGGGTYETIEWFTGSCGGTPVGTGNELSVSPASSTTYYGRYTDGTPCSYSTSCQSVTVTVNASPTAVITPGSTTSFCEGGSVTLTASGGAEYLWSTAETTADITATSAGYYTVTVTSANECTDTESQLVTVYPASVGGSVSGETTVCSGTNSTELTLTGYTGSIVKWQSSINGSDWSDIVNTSATYTATDLTVATWYRAVVQSGSCTAANSGSATISVSEPGNWLGLVSSDWNDDANWCGGIPTASTNVEIFADAPNMPEIGTENGECNNLTLNSGASLTVSSTNTLSVYGDWSGSGTFIPNNSVVSYSGSGAQNVAPVDYYNLNFRNNGIKTFLSGTTGIAKNFSLSESATADATTNSTTIDFNGSTTQNAAAINYHNLTFSNSDVKSFTTGTTGIANNFTISGTASANTGAYNCIINYNGSGAQSVQSISYNHLTFSNAGTKTLPAATFSVAGNWTNNGTVTEGTSTVNLNGSSIQTIGGSSSTTFNHVTLNNSNGATLATSQTVNGTLTLTNGTITLVAYDLLLGTSATISGSSSTKYIITNGVGALRLRVVNNATNVTFPIGLASDYLPVTMQLTVGSTADDFKIRVADGLSTTYDANDNPTGITITSSAVLKTWSITEGIAGGSTATVTLQWNLTNEGISFIRTSCDVAHYTGGIWVYATTGAASGSNPYTRTLSGITSFSPFAVFGARSINCFVGNASLCRGGAVSVDYAATGGTWNSGNIFTAQLSDINGSFGTPVSIGTLTSQVSGTINATIPSGTGAGAGYRIRVMSSNPATTGVNNGTDLTVDAISVGGTAGSPQTICGGSAPANLTLTGNTGGVLKWQKASDAGFTTPVDIDNSFNLTTLPGATIGVLTTATYFRAVVQNGACDLAYSTSVLISISGYTGDWLGITSTNWNTTTNWCGGVIPTSVMDVTIPSGVTYMPAVGTAGGVCRNITINADATLTINASSTLTVNGDLDNSGTLTVTTGTSPANSWLVMAGDVTNNNGATITATGSYTRFIFSSSIAQTFTNNGTVTSPVYSFDVANSHASGLTLAGSNGFTVRRANLFYGVVNNAGNITLGEGGTSSSVVQRGVSANTSPAGSFDEALTYNIGTGGLSLIYEDGSVAYSTGYEVPSGTLTATTFSLYDAADVTLGSDLTISSDLGFTGGTGTPKLRIGAHTLTLGGTLTYTVAGEFYGGATSNLTMNGATTLNTVTNGLNNLTINANVTLGGPLTVNGTLTLTSGAFANQSNLTMATGTTISRSGGSLASLPSFAGTVNLTYTGSSSITTGYEMPTGSTVLNNLTTNTGGVVQNSTPGATVDLLTDTFTDLTNWTGDIGNNNNQYSAVVSANAGGAANEGSYLYGAVSGTTYTASIYRAINTTGYTSLNIRWKQFIDNWDADIDPYTLKVQCASSPSGPWTDIYSLSPTGTANIGPETKLYYNWTTDVGATFYIRYYITGETYGIDYWYFDDLIIESSATPTPSTVTINNTLDLTNGTYTIGSNSLVLNGGKSGNSSLVGSTTSNLTVGGTASNLTLPAITNGLNNFTITRPNGVTSNDDLTVNGILNLQAANPSATQGSLEMGTDTLIMGASSATTGTGDVTGVIKRSTIVANVAYSFGNQFTTVKLDDGGTLPSILYTRVNIGTAPSWKTGAINRVYEFVQKGGSNATAAISSHYLDSELNSNDENLLVYWTGPTATDRGRSNYDLTDNWIVLQNVPIGDWPTAFGYMEVTIAQSGVANLTWNGSQSTNWETNTNWTPTGTPSYITDIIIPDASTTTYDPVVPATAAVKNVTIANGGIVNTTAGAQLSVYGVTGAWSNNGGTFNPGTSRVIFKRLGATMAGETSFYDLEIATDSSLTMEYDTYIRISGSMTNNGTWRADNDNTTVEYDGSDQTVVNPNGSPEGYHHLKLSGSGTKTMPTGALRVNGSFTTSGSASATAGSALTVFAHVVLGSGTTFNGSTYTHNVAGNWTNNGGTFTASTGTINLNGASLQTLGGSSSTTFNNLTLNNATGLSLAINETINGTLTFTNGKITTGIYTLSMGSSASVSGAGTGKYVYGKLLWNIPTGTPSMNFFIGDASYYTPVNISFSNVTTPGTLLGNTTGEHHPEIMGSGINALKTVNRYWSFTNTTTAFSNFNATFSFVAEDVDAGADYNNFIVRRWDGSS